MKTTLSILLLGTLTWSACVDEPRPPTTTALARTAPIDDTASILCTCGTSTGPITDASAWPIVVECETVPAGECTGAAHWSMSCESGPLAGIANYETSCAVTGAETCGPVHPLDTPAGQAGLLAGCTFGAVALDTCAYAPTSTCSPSCARKNPRTGMVVEFPCEEVPL
ncbi:MAG: hypothetical protein R2939_01930 [Kofleriaceae bacterium]